MFSLDPCHQITKIFCNELLQVMWLTAARTWRPAGHSDQSAMLAVRRTVRYQLVEWNDIFSVVRACWTLSVGHPLVPPS